MNEGLIRPRPAHEQAAGIDWNHHHEHGGGPLIVPQAQIKRLTGYVRASAQVRWLKQHGWKFAVNALGDPIVSAAEFNRHLVGGKKPGDARV